MAVAITFAQATYLEVRAPLRTPESKVEENRKVAATWVEAVEREGAGLKMTADRSEEWIGRTGKRETVTPWNKSRAYKAGDRVEDKGRFWKATAPCRSAMHHSVSGTGRTKDQSHCCRGVKASAVH